MPDITAFSKAFRDWEALIGQCNENASLVPGHEPLKADLAAILEKARELKVQQESLEGNRLAATDLFLNKVDEGRQLARKLRSFIVSVLGPRSPYLSLFGISAKPVPLINRRNKRKTKPGGPTEPPTTPPASGGESSNPPASAKAAE